MAQNTLNELQLLRAKAREGNLTREDAKRAVQLLRADRTNLPQATAGSRVRKSTKKQVDGDALLNELEGL